MNDAVVSGEEVFQNVLTNIFSPIYQLCVGIALVYFFWGVFMFIKNMHEPDEMNNGKRHLLWGTVGLFIILSVGGILPIFTNIFGGMFSS